MSYTKIYRQRVILHQTLRTELSYTKIYRQRVILHRRRGVICETLRHLCTQYLNKSTFKQWILLFIQTSNFYKRKSKIYSLSFLQYRLNLKAYLSYIYIGLAHLLLKVQIFLLLEYYQ
jgi:hypothetical protein